MPAISQNVINLATPKYHILCGDPEIAICDDWVMEDQEKNGGPNHLRAWREHRGLTQKDMADAVGTTQHQIAYLEAGERALSAKWLRKLAPVLGITPGLLLDHDPAELGADIIDIWSHASARQRRQIFAVVEAIVKDGTAG